MAHSDDANESRKIFDNYLYRLIKLSNLLFDDAVAKKFKINDLDDARKASIIRVTVYFVIYLAYKSILQIHKDSAERISSMAFSYLNLIHLNIQEKRLAEGKQREDTSYRQEEYNELQQQLEKYTAIFPPFDTNNDDEWVKMYLASVVGWYSFYIADTCGVKGDDFLRWVKGEKNILGSFWGLVGMTAEAIEKASMDLLVALNEHKT